MALMCATGCANTVTYGRGQFMYAGSASEEHWNPHIASSGLVTREFEPKSCLDATTPGIALGDEVLAHGDACPEIQDGLPDGVTLAFERAGPTTTVIVRRTELDWDAARIVCTEGKVEELVVYESSLAPRCLQPLFDGNLSFRWEEKVREIFETNPPPRVTPGLVVSKRGVQLYLVPADLNIRVLVPVLRMTASEVEAPPPPSPASGQPPPEPR